MKKQIKKFAAIVLSAMMMQSLAVMPANAAVATRTGTNFETGCSYTVPNGGGFSVGGAFTARNYAFETITSTDAEGNETNTYTTENFSIVNDPKAHYIGDKAFKMVRADGKQTGIWNYTGQNKTVQVQEFDILFETFTNNMCINFQIKDKVLNKGIDLYVLQTRTEGSDKMHIAGSNSTNVVPVGEEEVRNVTRNEWHHLKIITDFTATKILKETDAETGVETSTTVQDLEKNTITIYFDDIAIHKATPISSLRSDILTSYPHASKELIGLSFNGSGTVYLDNYYRYDTGTDTSFEMKSGEDYEGGSFVNGKTFDFYAESIMGTDLTGYFVNKVEWYVDGALKETKTVSPFGFSCTPTEAGKHTVSAVAYSGSDPIEPFAFDEMTFYVEPPYSETVLLKEDFNTHDGTFTLTDVNDSGKGMIRWADATGNGSWIIRNTTAQTPPSLVTVDDAHGNSMWLGEENGRRMDGIVTPGITSGTVKTSMEMYLEGAVGNNNNIMVLMLGKDTYSMRMHNAQNLLDLQNKDNVVGTEDGTRIASFENGRWYKIDWITTIKNGTAYYTVYVDGKQLAQNAYAEGTDVSIFNGAIFLNSYNTAAGKIYIDNLSISTIEYYDNTGFWCGDDEVTSIKEMLGTVLTAKTAVVNENENQQYMAVYDKTTNALLKVVNGTYDETTCVYTASCDLSEFGEKEIYAKVFVWDSMRPTLAEPEIIQ